jgi:hypothetical protein
MRIRMRKDKKNDRKDTIERDKKRKEKEKGKDPEKGPFLIQIVHLGPGLFGVIKYKLSDY